MKKPPQTPQARLIALLGEVLAIAESMGSPAQPVAKGRIKAGPAGDGVYPHQSKYNPWRAYVWDTKLRRTVYLGAFPSVSKARAAQRAYRAGEPITNGTKAGPKLALVA